MTSYGHGTNLVEDEYVDQDEDDLDDFIVESEDDDNMVVEEQEQEQWEEEEEEAPVGQQEILSLREKLKADLRRKNQANRAAGGKASCSSSVQAPVNDRFGTFFGPSRPSLARRVIEEGCSSVMKEIQNVSSRKNVPLASKAQPNASGHQQKPKPVSEEKRKVDTLRQNRDYSSVFSDDADIPPPAKEQPNSMSALPSTSDCEPMHSAGKSKVSTNQHARLPRDHGLKGGAPSSIQSRVQSKAGSLGKEPLPNRKRIIAAAKNGSSLPAMKKTPGLLSSNGQKPQQSLQSKRPQALLPGQRQQQSSPSQRLQQSLHSQSQGQQSHGPQSLQSRKPKPSFQAQYSGQKVSVQSHDRSKLPQKQLGPSSKLKPSRPMSSNAVYDDHEKRKRAVKRKSDDEFDHVKISSMIRGMFNYNPEKYLGRDDDDCDMEADYASIQKEERRSAKLARKEDEEQFRLIQEEERRERERKKKMSAHKH